MNLSEELQRWQLTANNVGNRHTLSDARGMRERGCSSERVACSFHVPGGWQNSSKISFCLAIDSCPWIELIWFCILTNQNFKCWLKKLRRAMWGTTIKILGKLPTISYEHSPLGMETRWIRSGINVSIYIFGWEICPYTCLCTQPSINFNFRFILYWIVLYLFQDMYIYSNIIRF